VDATCKTFDEVKSGPQPFCWDVIKHLAVEVSCKKKEVSDEQRQTFLDAAAKNVSASALRPPPPPPLPPCTPSGARPCVPMHNITISAVNSLRKSPIQAVDYAVIPPIYIQVRPERPLLLVRRRLRQGAERRRDPRGEQRQGGPDRGGHLRRVAQGDIYSRIPPCVLILK